MGYYVESLCYIPQKIGHAPDLPSELAFISFKALEEKVEVIPRLENTVVPNGLHPPYISQVAQLSCQFLFGIIEENGVLNRPLCRLKRPVECSIIQYLMDVCVFMSVEDMT